MARPPGVGNPSRVLILLHGGYLAGLTVLGIEALSRPCSER